MNEKLSPRLYAIKVLLAVLQAGKSLDQAHAEHKTSIPDGTKSAVDRALGRALSYGVLREYYRLKLFVDALIERPLRDRDQDVLMLIMIGLFQLLQHRAPEYAVVSESVKVVAGLGKGWAKGLVNAVLRKFIREQKSLLQRVEQDQQARYAMPKWLLETVKSDWPEHWQTVLQASNQQGPMVLRVNRTKINREAYRELLLQDGLEAEAVAEVADAVRMLKACDVERLPGFARGLVSVQDSAAQWAAQLLDVRPGQRVLDACAAPGGKTLHILECQPALAVLHALDSDAGRAERIYQNLDRLMPNATQVEVKVADAANLAKWWDKLPYDRVLLDAPCTGTGVIRRHPDIPLLRRPDDVQNLQQQQWRLLTRVWETVADGGMLLYCTCSIIKAENEATIQRFLGRYSNAEALPVALPGALAEGAGVQFLPGITDTDGFYYALLRKRP